MSDSQSRPQPRPSPRPQLQPRHQPRPQDFASHRNIPRLFLAAGAVLAIDELRRLWQAVTNPGWSSAWSVIVGMALLVTWFLMRAWALRLQDRVIRGEMQRRLERLLGTGRHDDIAGLRRSQLIALRFAADAELPALVDDVLGGKLSEPDEIKRRISDWQADWLRV